MKTDFVEDLWEVGVVRRRDVKSYCRFSRRRLVCPYPEEERTLAFCMVCKVTRLTNQLDLVIKQNKVIIDVLMKIRDSLKREGEMLGDSFL